MKRDPYINRTIFSEYLIQKKIGKGSFGTVYQGIVLSTRQKIAVKLEKIDKKDSGLLEAEACRLYLMQGEGIPKIVCYGNNKTHNILIQELLGNSLEELFNTCKKKFTLKTVCSIGIEMIKRIRFVHSKHHIHRDIKPDNFMTGREKNDNKIYIIDFGLAKKYYSSTKKHHIRFRTGKNLIGTARYCGRNAHRGYEQGRRDDIESIGYVLMYFLNGFLPWQGIKILKTEDHFQKIAEKKYETTFEELTEGSPEEFLLYFKHCDSLKFEDEPNYDYLINLFQTVINKYCIDCLYDYDWKKNTIPVLSYVKDKEENNNKENKDISLLVHNNVSAIESKGEGKEEDKENKLKMKKDIYIVEDKHNHNNNNTDYKYRKLKKNQSALNYFKDNLGIGNDIIELKRNNDIKKDSPKNNNIFFLNNPMTPQVQNINININFNNNLKKNSNKDHNNFNKSEINIAEDLFNDLYNKDNNHNYYNNQTPKNNYYLFKKNNIKKEILLSYDKNMDDMMKSHRNSLIDEKNIQNMKDYKQYTRFQKPKKLDSIFTEEDIKMEELNDISESEIEKIVHTQRNSNTQINDVIKTNNIRNIKTFHNKIQYEQEYNKKQNNSNMNNNPNNSNIYNNPNNSNMNKNQINSNNYNNQNNSYMNKNLNNSRIYSNPNTSRIYHNPNNSKIYSNQNNSNMNKNLNNSNLINYPNINKYYDKNNKENHHKLRRNRSVVNYTNINNNNNFKEINVFEQENILKPINIKENKKVEERNTDYENNNNNHQKKKRNRVRSVDNKMRRSDSGCCIIF